MQGKEKQKVKPPEPLWVGGGKEQLVTGLQPTEHHRRGQRRVGWRRKAVA